MIYIKESYNRKGLLSEKTIFYLHAIDEFVFDYKYYQEEKRQDYSFQSSDNGFEFYYQGRLWLKGYLVEKE